MKLPDNRMYCNFFKLAQWHRTKQLYIRNKCPINNTFLTLVTVQVLVPLSPKVRLPPASERYWQVLDASSVIARLFFYDSRYPLFCKQNFSDAHTPQSTVTKETESPRGCSEVLETFNVQPSCQRQTVKLQQLGKKCCHRNTSALFPTCRLSQQWNPQIFFLFWKINKQTFWTSNGFSVPLTGTDFFILLLYKTASHPFRITD